MANNTLLKIDKFLGLHASYDASTELKDGEASSMTNFKITEGYKLKRREGFSVIREGQERVRGLWCGTLTGNNAPQCAAVIGTGVYVSDKDFSSLTYLGELSGEEDITFFPFDGKLYVLNGIGIKEITLTGVYDIVPYRPTVMISTTPKGSGSLYESPNMLTGQVSQLFSPDGTSSKFKLCYDSIISIDGAYHNGEEIPSSSYTADLTNGYITFNDIPEDGYPDSLRIDFTVENEEGKRKINGCRYAVAYGGDDDTRCFLWGNREYPAVRFFSGAVNGEKSISYFPDENFTLIGDGEEITSMLRHYDRLLIFTKSKAYYSYASERTDGNGRYYISFPVFPLSSEVGSIIGGEGITIDNHPCTVSFDGLYKWTSTSVRDERNARCFTSRIAKELTAEMLEGSRLFNRKSTKELYLLCQSKIYIYNYSLDVFYKYEDVNVRHMAENDRNELFLALEDGRICISGGDDDGGEAIRCEWFSKYYDMGYPHLKKNIFTVTLTVHPGVFEYTELSWATDRASHTGEDGSSSIMLGYRLFDFEELSFDDLSFDTSYVAKQLTARMRVRRFSHFKLALSSKKKGSDLHLISLMLNGNINQ